MLSLSLSLFLALFLCLSDPLCLSVKARAEVVVASLACIFFLCREAVHTVVDAKVIDSLFLSLSLTLSLSDSL
eukprot:COSAG03_NODE_1742_length_3579_cov_5.822701_5_plen_73_part_00